MKKEVLKLIKDIKPDKKSTIDILHIIQNNYGFLPKEILIDLSEYLNTSLSYIYGVASFYNDFTFVKKSKYQINICLGTVCYVKGSKEILEEIKKILNINENEITNDGLFSLDTTRCLGCCSMAPVIKINDDIYGFVKIDEVKSILEKYK